MLISKHWLQEFVDVSKIAPEEIARRLTLSTVEVEAVRALGAELDGVVIGLVRTLEKHPNADTLSVCRVAAGTKEVTVVCGGSNVRAGMKVALAQTGAKVRWHGQGALIELKPVEIRGVASAGMICASDEIGLLHLFPKKAEKEILDLSGMSAKPGTPLAHALQLHDVIFDIDNKSLSHRPDLWGHIGIAREISALFNKTVRPYAPPAIPKRNGVPLAVEVQEKRLCHRYLAVAIDAVDVRPSPAWLQTRLLACGVRPVNNIVDCTNYVMLEAGQPMHAFDADCVDGNRVVVRMAATGETLQALDAKKYAFTEDMLVIADRDRPIAIAGIMGGAASGVTAKTTRVILESATFDSGNIRKTSNALGLRSESSVRFEKGLTVERAELALRRAVALVLAECPKAKVASAVIDKKQIKTPARSISMTTEDIAHALGLALPLATVKQILQRLGFGVVSRGGRLRVAVPSWRSAKDISLPADIIEEIIRVHGFNRIPPALPRFPITPPVSNPLRVLEYRLKELLALECGFTETYNYSFVSSELMKKIGLDTEEHFALQNPMAKDRPYLRRNLFPNLLENVEANLHRFDAVRLFETGRVYEKSEDAEALPPQDLILGMAYAAKNTTVPFYAIAGAAQRIFSRLDLSVVFRKDASPLAFAHPGRAAQLVIHDTVVGWIAEIHPATAERLGISARVAVLEANLDGLLPFVGAEKKYRPIPPYPAVTRDLAFILPKEIEHTRVMETIRSVSPLIVSASLFDVFEGAGIPVGKKSMAYHVVYQSPDRTLEASEIDAVHGQVGEALKPFGVDLR